MGDIVWQRWIIYFVFGTPLLAWLFFTRSNVLRLSAVLAILIFVQNSLAARRFIWAIGIGPSVAVLYVALIASIISRKRLPPLGSIGIAWSAFLFLAFMNLFIAVSSGSSLEFNVVRFQEVYFEAFLMFAMGSVALSSEEETKRFLFCFVLIGLGVAFGHFVTLATGFRFRDYAPKPSAIEYIYGGFLDNPNSMGSFYCMAVPPALLLLTSGRLPRAQRILTTASVVAMLASLMVAVHRGGILTTALLSVVVIATTAKHSARALGLATAAGLLVTLSYGLLAIVRPEFLDAAWQLADMKGVQTPRTAFYPILVDLAVRNPFGIGLTDDNLQRLAATRGLQLASTHNLYLAVALQTGVLGLGLFLYMVGSVVSRARRARRLASEPLQREVLTALLMAMTGFLVVGMSESIWENGYKINHTFWLLAGVSFASSLRILGEAQARGSEEASERSGALDRPAHGLPEVWASRVAPDSRDRS